MVEARPWGGAGEGEKGFQGRETLGHNKQSCAHAWTNTNVHENHHKQKTMRDESKANSHQEDFKAVSRHRGLHSS